MLYYALFSDRLDRDNLNKVEQEFKDEYKKRIFRDETTFIKLAKISLFVKDAPGVTISQVAREHGLRRKYAERYLEVLCKHGIIKAELDTNNLKRYYPTTKEFFDAASHLLSNLEEYAEYILREWGPPPPPVRVKKKRFSQYVSKAEYISHLRRLAEHFPLHAEKMKFFLNLIPDNKFPIPVKLGDERLNKPYGISTEKDWEFWRYLYEELKFNVGTIGDLTGWSDPTILRGLHALGVKLKYGPRPNAPRSPISPYGTRYRY